MPKGFPFYDSVNSPIKDIDTIIAQEGESLVLYSETTGNILTSTTSSSPANMGLALDNTTASGGPSFASISAGRMLWIESINVGVVGLPAGTTVSFQIGGFGDAASKFTQFVIRGTYSAGCGNVTIPVRKLFRQIRADRSGLAAQIRTVVPAVSSTTPVTFVATAMCSELTDDPHFHALETIAVFGDSLNYGKGWGPAYTNDLYAFKLRDRFRLNGHDVRNVSFSQPGRTTTMMESDRSSGAFDFLHPSMGVYALGTNDAIIAAANYVTTAQSNLVTFWQWWSGRFPDKPLLVVSPGPMNDSTYMSNAAALTAGLTSTVSSIDSPNLKIVNISTAFTNTDTSRYRASDNVHWNTAGHLSVWATISSFLDANPTFRPIF